MNATEKKTVTSNTEGDNIKLPLSKLILSHLNMRSTEESEQVNKPLKASLASFGVLQNLIVHTMEGKKTFAVAGGGRRLFLLKQLVKEKKIKANMMVPCKVVPEERALAASVAENQTRTAPHPADEFRAYNKLVDAGVTQKSIAAEFGVSKTYVRQRLALGKLHPDLLAAYRAGKLEMSGVQTFTIEPDPEKQLECYESLADLQRKQPYFIRKSLSQSSMSDDDALVSFVGMDAYRAAGGDVRTDLFGKSTLILNPEIIQDIARQKLEAKAEEVRAAGFGWAVTLLTDDEDIDWSKHAVTDSHPAPKDLAAEHETLQDRYDELHWLADNELSKALKKGESREGIEERISELEFMSLLQYPAELRPGLGVFIELDDNNNIGFIGPVKRLDEKSPDCDGAENGDGAGSSDSNLDLGETGAGAKRGYSQALMDDLRKDRTLAFQSMLNSNDALVMGIAQFATCEAVFLHVFERQFWYRPPCDRVKFGSLAGGEEGVSYVSKFTDDLMEKGLLEWVRLDTTFERFQSFIKLPIDGQTRLYRLAWIEQFDIPLRDLMSEKDTNFASMVLEDACLFSEFKGHVQLTRENFFSRIGKTIQLEIICEVLSAERADELSTQKKADLADFLHELFNDKPTAIIEGLEQLPDWMPEGF